MMGGPQSHPGRGEEIPSPRLESNPRTPIVQHEAQRYTNWAIMDIKGKFVPVLKYCITKT
jgi:hypothetical protein